jgi:hypothetical protein
MTIYDVKFQIGDFVFFTKKIAVASVIKCKVFESKPLMTLPEANGALPKFYSQLNVDSEIVASKLTVKKGKLYYIRSLYNNYYIKLSDYNSFDEYLLKFSAKSRSTLKRKVRKAEEAGFTHKLYSKVDEVTEFHSYACRVGNDTYQNNLFNSSIPSDESYRNEILDLAKKGLFLGGILFKDEKPCAYLYTPVNEDQYIYAYLGYLAEFSAFSPGTVLQFQVLQYIFDKEPKAKFFNFTEGNGQHKVFFSTDKKMCCNCLIIESSAYHYLLLTMQTIFDFFSTFLGKMLDKFNLRTKIKKLIRKQ